MSRRWPSGDEQRHVAELEIGGDLGLDITCNVKRNLARLLLSTSTLLVHYLQTPPLFSPSTPL